ncbi:MAG: SRPBCC domain-containing protein [Phycisphaerae bacterium]|nr:SRPBCC domain-containing protein [Phycisphaerae bacterium]
MSETERAVFKVHIRGRIEDVWQEITKTDSLQKAIFNARLHTNGLKPGGKMQMRSANGKYVIVVGDVLEFDPPHRFSHTFKFTTLPDPPCKVTYDLKEVSDSVEFTLTVDDMPKGTQTAKHMTTGGKTIVDTLKVVVETGKPPFGVRFGYAMQAVMGPFVMPFIFGKKCHSENWPL